MKKLHLLRHAHTVSGDPMEPDHARRLSERGRAECMRLGAIWRDKKLSADLVLCSTAVRAAETYEALKAAAPDLPEATYQPKLYLASAEEILKVLKNAAGSLPSLLVIGHNPGLHELGLILDLGYGPLLDQLERGLPPAGMMCFDTLCDEWAELGERGARLVGFEVV